MKRSPLWRHGGVVFGPRTKFVRLTMPRQKARLALAQALAARHAEGGVVFVDSLAFPEAKTKAVALALGRLGCDRGALVVLDQADKKLSLASRNIPGVEVRLAGDLNAWMVLRSRRLVLTRAALEKLGARWS
jgi:large subunit ribosomal protein L4